MKNMSGGQQFMFTSSLKERFMHFLMVSFALALFLFAGCETIRIVEVPAPKQFDCGGERDVWYCKSRATELCIRNEIVEAEACNSIERTD